MPLAMNGAHRRRSPAVFRLTRCRRRAAAGKSTRIGIYCAAASPLSIY
jgi:hypothetical protein